MTVSGQGPKLMASCSSGHRLCARASRSTLRHATGHTDSHQLHALVYNATGKMCALSDLPGEGMISHCDMTTLLLSYIPCIR